MCIYIYIYIYQPIDGHPSPLQGLGVLAVEVSLSL